MLAFTLLVLLMDQLLHKGGLLLDAKAVARHLSVCERTVYLLVRDGKLRSIRFKPGGPYRFRPEDVLAFQDASPAIALPVFASVNLGDEPFAALPAARTKKGKAP